MWITTAIEQKEPIVKAISLTNESFSFAIPQAQVQLKLAGTVQVIYMCGSVRMRLRSYKWPGLEQHVCT